MSDYRSPTEAGIADRLARSQLSFESSRDPGIYGDPFFIARQSLQASVLSIFETSIGGDTIAEARKGRVSQ